MVGCLLCIINIQNLKWRLYDINTINYIQRICVSNFLSSSASGTLCNTCYIKSDVAKSNLPSHQPTTVQNHSPALPIQIALLLVQRAHVLSHAYYI